MTYVHDDINEHMDHVFRIMLVEDDPVIQIAMLGILQDYLGYTVQVAHSGEEAIELFPQGFDLVLMDVGLPGIDGVEATRKLRKLYPENKTPIIAHTAHGDEKTKEHCIDAGMTNFISKGDSLETFERIIAKDVNQYIARH